MAVLSRQSITLFVRRLVNDTSGVSLIEFAFLAPVLLTLGLMGTEVAHRSIVSMQLSQLALSLADNASRLGQTDNSSVTPTISEADVASIMSGAMRQGASIALGKKGRIILSSLEYDTATGKQFIHWQRCQGELEKGSTYGDEDTRNGLGSAPITGVGQSADKIRAAPGSAVMVAEVYYEYESLIAGRLIDDGIMRQEAVFAIRDDRNLGPGVTGGSGVSQCT